MLSPRFARARYRRRGARDRESPSWGVSLPGVKITREWRSPGNGELDRDPAYVRATLNGVGHPIGEPSYGHTGQAPRDGSTWPHRGVEAPQQEPGRDSSSESDTRPLDRRADSQPHAGCGRHVGPAVVLHPQLKSDGSGGKANDGSGRSGGLAGSGRLERWVAADQPRGARGCACSVIGKAQDGPREAG